MRCKLGSACVVALLAFAGAGQAQMLQNECPLEDVGLPCAAGDLCVEYTCRMSLAGQEDRTSTYAACETVTNPCPRGAGFMDPCGDGGTCWGTMTELQGPYGDGGTERCSGSYYRCVELPNTLPPFPTDAGPPVDGGVDPAQDGGGKGQPATLEAGPGEDSAPPMPTSAGGAPGSPEAKVSDSGGCTVHAARTSPSGVLALLAVIGAALVRIRRAGPLRVWDHVDGALVERRLPRAGVAASGPLGLFWVTRGEPGRQHLRLSEDADGTRLLPTAGEEARAREADAREDATRARRRIQELQAELARHRR
jgi:MYXO-CTERM domain-containing protein